MCSHIMQPHQRFSTPHESATSILGTHTRQVPCHPLAVMRVPCRMSTSSPQRGLTSFQVCSPQVTLDWREREHLLRVYAANKPISCMHGVLNRGIAASHLLR